ncbi:hypothetical protein WEU38_18245 (plasmid) [Cyanobacterium aponinum AL20118]|uniref:Uncharacterized protein n=1 Tax=Cyanobacterium aponinum AL20115 TaxID=3090662 RepID=A0AAF0ZCG9_9CHRO|nr:hypothetical protein [Cyanobacterium aponinum]WPF90511.1 hypothetical protein SAY89_18320 [Cyanobacterium aponinum AL20115]
MGYIREKKINGESKYYWIASKRDGKKSGGTGKVIKVERYLGDRHYHFYKYLGDGEPSFSADGFFYLSWYVWNNDFKLDDFIDKLVAFNIKCMIDGDKLNYTLIKQNKVIFIKKKDSRIDLRESYYRYWKNKINKEIEDNKKSVQFISLLIDEIIECLGWFNYWIKTAKKKNKKIEIDDYIDCENRANEWFNYANKNLEKILKYVPRTQREEAKKKIWGYCLRECRLEKLDL